MKAKLPKSLLWFDQLDASTASEETVILQIEPHFTDLCSLTPDDTSVFIVILFHHPDTLFIAAKGSTLRLCIWRSCLGAMVS